MKCEKTKIALLQFKFTMQPRNDSWTNATPNTSQFLPNPFPLHNPVVSILSAGFFLHYHTPLYQLLITTTLPYHLFHISIALFCRELWGSNCIGINDREGELSISLFPFGRKLKKREGDLLLTLYSSREQVENRELYYLQSSRKFEQGRGRVADWNFWTDREGRICSC